MGLAVNHLCPNEAQTKEEATFVWIVQFGAIPTRIPTAEKQRVALFVASLGVGLTESEWLASIRVYRGPTGGFTGSELAPKASFCERPCDPLTFGSNTLKVYIGFSIHI